MQQVAIKNLLAADSGFGKVEMFRPGSGHGNGTSLHAMDSDILSAVDMLIPLLVVSDIRFPGKWYAGDYTARSGPPFNHLAVSEAG
jgi:hypothetical protein